LALLLVVLVSLGLALDHLTANFFFVWHIFAPERSLFNGLDGAVGSLE